MGSSTVCLLEQKSKLYQTLRKTLINETVCRGLNPHAPRKDSGIEWIGQIPAHWEVKRLKSFATSVKGKAVEGSQEKQPGALPILALDYLRNESSPNATYLMPTRAIAPNAHLAILAVELEKIAFDSSICSHFLPRWLLESHSTRPRDYFIENQ